MSKIYKKSSFFHRGRESRFRHFRSILFTFSAAHSIMNRQRNKYAEIQIFSSVFRLWVPSTNEIKKGGKKQWNNNMNRLFWSWSPWIAPTWLSPANVKPAGMTTGIFLPDQAGLLSVLKTNQKLQSRTFPVRLFIFAFLPCLAQSGVPAL